MKPSKRAKVSPAPKSVKPRSSQAVAAKAESESDESGPDEESCEEDAETHSKKNIKPVTADGTADTDSDDSDDFDEENSSISAMSYSDSDMSSDEVSDEEEEEAKEALHVPLPEEFAELAAGRDENEGDEDDVVQAILRAREKHRNHPPAIECSDGVAALSFNPNLELIAVGTFTGDVAVYKYSDDVCELQSNHELHVKAIRDVEFSKDGKHILSCSKDKSILRTDVETGKLTNMWDGAHSSPINTLYILDEHRFCTGCEEGYVKLWDTRQKEAVFSLRVMEDHVSAIISTPQNRHLAVASGGTITSINVNSRKIQVQSEDYDHDFTCLGLFRHDTKLLAGSSKGTMFLFNWGEFGLHSDEFTGFKQPLSCLLPVTETVAITGWEDGKLRATHLFPHQPLGIVGQHDFSVECLDVSNDGGLIASAAAAGGYVKFWNIKYIEEIQVSCTKKKKKKAELNLPSSSVRNAGDFFADLAGTN